MVIREGLEVKEKEIQRKYLKEAREKGIRDEDYEVLKEVTKRLDRGERVEGMQSYQDRLRVYGYKGVPMYEEYKIRKELELIDYLESRGVTKIIEQSGYIGVARRKGGRLNRHLRYKRGELELDRESLKMLEEYKRGKTLEEISELHGMSKANVGYKLEVVDPEYAYKYGKTSYNLMRDKGFVKRIKEKIELGYVDDRIKREEGLPNVEILKVLRE